MRQGDHIIAGQALLELRGFRLWNRTTADLVSSTIDDVDQQPDTVLGNGSSMILGSSHAGLVFFNSTTARPAFWNGSALKGFNDQAPSSGQFADFSLADGKILVGHSDGKAWERTPSYLSLSVWGAPTGDLDLNGFRVTNAANPVNNGDLATKGYVDSNTAGLQTKTEAVICTTNALPSCTYSGGAGTLTATANGALVNTAVDSGASGVTLVAGGEGTGTRILVRDQATSIQNGVYRLSTLGSGGAPWVLTRTADSDSDAELRAAYILVTSGTHAGIGYQQTVPTGSFNISAATGTLVWSKFLTQTQYSEGNGIDISSNVVSLWVGGATTWTAGCILYGSSSSALGKVDGGSGVANRHLIYDHTNTRPAWSAWTLPATIVANDIYFASSTTAMTAVASRAASRVLITNGSGVPTWSNALPAVTINGATPLLDNAVVPISLGGTGLSHSGSGAASMLYKSGSTFAATSAAPVVGSVPMCTVAGTTMDMVDLFARANTWGNTNTFQDATGTSPSNILARTSVTPSEGAEAGSAALEWQGKHTASAVVYYHHFRARAQGRSFRMDRATQSVTPTGSGWVNWFLWDDAAETLSILPSSTGTKLVLGSTTIEGSAVSTVDFPAPGGTVAVRDLSNTFLAGQAISVGAGLTNLALYRTAEAKARLGFDGEGSGGGRIRFGAGGASDLDTTIERTGAQALAYTGLLAITKPGGAGGLVLNAGTEVTGSGLWRAGVLELTYGGLGANASGYAAGTMVYKSGSAFVAMGGTNGANRIPISTGSAVNWSAYSIPASLAAGDLLFASATTALSALAKPGSDAFVLGLSSGVPAWRATAATVGVGTSGGTAGIPRAWACRYTGAALAQRYTSFTHGLGSRNVTGVTVRKTNSDDSLTNSEAWVTRWDVTDSNNVRVWFPTPPGAGETYIVTVSVV